MKKFKMWKTGSAMIFMALMMIASSTLSRADQIQIRGSDTVLPLAQMWAEAFMKSHRGETIAVTGGGSGVGIAALINGTVDIANSSRPMKDSEKEKLRARGVHPVEHKVALDGLSIIVNPANPVRALTIAQVAYAFNGKGQNWSQLGGNDERIVAAARQSSSGTYAFFQENVMKNAKYVNCQHLVSNNAICQVVSRSRGGIGYVGLAYAEKWAKQGKVKILPIARSAGGTPVEPTEATVRNGSYPIWRYLFNYTAGTPHGLAASYLAFVKSSKGQALVAKSGYIAFE